VTGDRIHLDFRMNGNITGKEVRLESEKPPRLTIVVDGWNCLDRVILLTNGRVMKRWTDFDNNAIGGSNRFKVWVHWGYRGSADEKNWNSPLKHLREGSRLVSNGPTVEKPGSMDLDASM
jgi:hypothetical protein